ncbi:MAG: MBL fold metallo-hydrolase [Nitrososphaerota archaeon]
MEIRFLGGTREVGRSAVEVSYKNTKLLLDYGVMLNDHPHFPQNVEPRKLNGILLTHSHLDHSGAAPMLYISQSPKLYATSMTRQTTTMLVQDFIKLSGYYLPFEKAEVEAMLKSCREVHYREPFMIRDIEVEFIDAGHIPGSAQILLKGDKTLVYTGDFTTVKTRMLEGADTNIGDVDGVIIESTYALEDHKPRPELEKQFVNACREVVENGGRVLVPAFSVGRAQEILCVLAAHGFRQPIWLDGMARKALEHYLADRRYVDGYEILERASRKARIVNGRRGREAALSEPGVIVTPAGMLKGGPALHYAPYIVSDEKSAVFLVSFQIPNTPGEILLNQGVFMMDGLKRKAVCRVEQFRFSGHAGMSELHNYLKQVETDATVFTIHGEVRACEELSHWASTKLEMKALAPRAGEKYSLT